MGTTPGLLPNTHCYCAASGALQSRSSSSNHCHRVYYGGFTLIWTYYTALTTSSCGAYLYIGTKYHPFVLRLSDIQFCGDEGQAVTPHKATIVGILLRGAKNNQFGREEFRFQHASGDSLLCPVRAARWIKIAAKETGTAPHEPVLTMGSSGGISSSHVPKVIKIVALEAGLDAGRFSTHSVRIATKLLNAGADRLVIKLLGRWLSSCYEDYPDLTSEGTAGLSKLMCQ
ncbi:LOW QUALITY PROTEIN: hypothetical protein PHMEG_0004736 [Phytophthora megakarya]|uniref:Tyr recombinase domain-containing protein n=1 Tax=Phytophthora megakarya TaxID=4795 RepID=A0A225WUS9_9STRA|nr:LOW QUALITY PROTEIN: hypothetical protein PHMEG_0004736 [Phytophthora megakarya]